MFKIPKKVQDRLLEQTKQFQKIAEQQKIRDVSEADTVTLVKDILASVFGYDKYQELTSSSKSKALSVISQFALMERSDTSSSANLLVLP
jgi:hypothetical protein